MPEFTLLVNGFMQSASYSKAAVDEVLIPLLRHWTALQHEKRRRFVVYLAAPPGSGKSTLASILESLSHSITGINPIQALGMDGFHYCQAYIETHKVMMAGREVPMKQVKGCPESFDVEKMKRAISLLAGPHATWPVYDRNLHDVIEDAIEVNASAVLIEGNWMLLDAPQWRQLRSLCDYSVMLYPELASLEQRLISRKQRGGSTHEDAHRHYERCDNPNVQLCLERRLPADAILFAQPDGGLSCQMEVVK